MKAPGILLILTIIFCLQYRVPAQSVCCPEFILQDAIDICPAEGACTRHQGAPGGSLKLPLAACKNTPHVYTVYPNNLNFTYTWTVTGGTPASYNGNPLTVVWGSGSTGYIKVVISDLNSGGSCLDSIMQEICLIDGPQAGFLVSADTVCENTPVHFTNTSLGGSVYHWDFGDGATSDLANPPDHSYSSPGTYTVMLTATDMGAGHFVGGPQGETKVPCGCSDTISMVIVVLPGEGPVIELDCCFGTVCPGDTSSFCTPMVCNTYSWSVTGGTIISGAGTSCIKVKWNSTYTVPTTVTLQSCPSSACQGSTTLNVPVLYPNLPITGPNTLCIGSSGSYSLPWLPGTYYVWTVTGGLHTFNLQNRNTPSVNISFHTAGTYWVKCQYDNPLAGCNGVDSLQVNVLPVFAFFGDETVCESNVTTYTANGPANWTISPSGPVIQSGNGTPSINVLWTPGTFTITAAPLNAPAYCNASAFQNVEVIAKPVLGSITGPVTVCPAEKFIYSIASNVSGSPFVWSVSSGSVISEMGADKDSVLVSFTGSGPWTLSVFQQIEISPGNFCSSLPQSLVVSPYPPPTITGLQVVCVDDIVTYNAVGSNPPGDVQWTISPSNRGTIQTGQGTNTISVLWHGPATTAVLSVTNCAGTATHTITINDPPVAVASYSILPVFCLNDNQVVTLSTPTGTGYTYQWYLNGNPVSGGTSATLVLTNNLATFPAPGIYPYYVVVTQNGCSAKSNIVNIKIENCTGGGGPGPGCDVLAQFSTYVVCSQIFLIDQSIVIPPSTITSYQWSVTGPGTGTFTPNANVPNPVLTVSMSGTYTITLTIISSSGCVSNTQQNVTVLLPVANFTFTTPVCENTPAVFAGLPNNPSYSYSWTFGDGSTSYLPLTQHAYATAGNYLVSLVIKDEMGCVATASNTITVNPVPACTITVSDTTFCPGGSVTFSACAGMSSYQWYKNGSAIGGANSQTYSASQTGSYWVVVTNSFGCSSKSNKIFIYMLGLPKAEIYGEARVCGTAGGMAGFSLSAYYDPNYLYNWSSNPSGAIFSPQNGSVTWVSLTLPGTLPSTQQFIVDVTDSTTGCTASDTLCVIFYQSPVVNVNTLNICEGTPVTLTPTPIDTANFSYQWNNGATTPVILAFIPGFYSLTVTDKDNGCSTTVNAGSIYPKPDLSLFPLGCDSICVMDTLQLYMPLPLNAVFPNNTYANAYSGIDWYVNGNYGSPVGSGKNLSFTTNTAGSYQFSVVVTNSWGCVDTTGVFCLTVDECLPEPVLDFGDAPDFGEVTYIYPTLLANNGARHIINPAIYLGSNVDPEPDGQPNIPSSGDDTDLVYPSAGDDEDGVAMPAGVSPGATVTINVTASVFGYLDAWFDFNINGSWADPGEHIFNVQPVNAGTNALTFTVPASASPGNTYVRYRFRTFKAVINYDGLVSEGEVEDYAVFIEDVDPQGEKDFGDDPDNAELSFNYPTFLFNNGARHLIIPGIYIGNKVDAETDGQPNIPASGDDNDIFYPSLGDDEDGVLFTGTLYVGKTASVTVTASVPGFLNAWIDFNKNGDWVASPEHIFINQPLVAGSNPLSFTIPATALKGNTYTRFRFNTTGGLIYSGLAFDGEVEDYRVHLCPFWNPIPTDVIHSIQMPHTLNNLNPGDAIGVFYDDGTGNLVNAGLVEWDGVEDKVMTAFGDNPATPDIIEGFIVGQPIHWILCSKKKGTAIPVEVLFDPSFPSHDGLFTVGGLSALTDFIVTCGQPSGLTASDLTATSAVLDWNNGTTEGEWDILYGLHGFDIAAEGTLLAGITSHPVTLTELSPSTDYDFYVRAICGDEAMSGWSEAGSFTTLSDVVTGDANCDGFVNVLDIVTVVNVILGQEPSPFCFENADSNGDGMINVLDVVRIINLILGGKKSAQLDSDSNPAHIFLTSSGIELQSDGTLAGLQLDIDSIGDGAPLMNLEISGFEMVQQQMEGKLRVLIFSLENRTIPSGRIELIDFLSAISRAGWGDVLAGNVMAEPVEVVKHSEVLDVPDTNPAFSFHIFPNPGSGQFTIELNLLQESTVTWSLSDPTGRLLYSSLSVGYPAGVHRIDYQGKGILEDGIYFLRITLKPSDHSLSTIEKMSKVVIMK
jgi:PKD repeat protein